MIRWLQARWEAQAARVTLDIAPDAMRAAQALEDLWWKLPPGPLANDVAELQNQLTDLYEREMHIVKENS